MVEHNQPTHPDPWVQFFLRTDPDPEILYAAVTSGNSPLPPKVQAIANLLGLAIGKGSPDKMPELDAAYRDSSSVDLHIVFLVAWFRAVLFVEDDLPRMRALRDFMMSLVSEQTPQEIAAQVKIADYVVRNAEGDTASISIMDTLTDGIPRSSVHYQSLGVMRAVALFTLGMGVLVDDDELNADYSSVRRERLQRSRLANCAMTGDLETAKGLDLSLTLDTPGARHLGWRSHYTALLLMAQTTPPPKPTRLIESLRDLSPPPDPPWLQSTRRLLEGDPVGALRLARLAATTDLRELAPIAPDAYCFVRAELCNGNAASAKRLLDVRHNNGTRHYVDDLFYARAARLAGHHEQAARSFGKLLESVARFKAQGRLDFELRLSTELSHGDVALLAARSATTGPEEPAPVEVGGRPKHLTSEQIGTRRLIHRSPAMAELCDRIVSYANEKPVVLVTGETGTGKELVARALHESAGKPSSSFIPVNCAALTDALIESELFGHERGAFTGAVSSRRGLLLESPSSTVFLDEIADISPQTQAALLRVLETGEVRPVGSNKVSTIRCRIIAATNADLHAQVEDGRFRRDLFHRLDRLAIEIPPLRDRPEDIEPLAHYFLNLDRPDDSDATLSAEAIRALRLRHWSGNVRELRNTIERLRILNSDKLHYDAADLEEDLRAPLTTSTRSQGQLQNGRVSEAAPLDDDERYVRMGNSPLRRRDRLRELFGRFGKLTAAEAAHLLRVPAYTAARDLRMLCETGALEKRMPTASRRTHYYVEAGPWPED